jgi:1-deoxy-D-xylulose 5-phosphate reductoisomerase
LSCGFEENRLTRRNTLIFEKGRGDKEMRKRGDELHSSEKMMKSKKVIAILGSTGSIGTQTLDVVREHPELFEIYALTAHNNVDLLIHQAREFQPEMVVIANESLYPKLKEALSDLPIKVWAGEEALCQVVQAEPIQIVLTALVGYAGLRPTIQAIKAKKVIALANKETLVVAGELVSRLAIENRTPILPVDSEHSAIFQCLVGEGDNPIEKIWLTASGGPFRNYTREQLEKVTKVEALKHPNWNMGAKITIDSASMMNKGFEMIEAKWLFDVDPQQIEIVVHPQSIIHSMVQFADSSVKAQLGLPDMRLPIQYALTYPDRIFSGFERLDFRKCKSLTFDEPDLNKFRNLQFAFEAVKQGGNIPCVLNAANEIAVDAFLKDRCGFLQMSEIIEQTMQAVGFIEQPSLDDYIQTNTEARKKATEIWRQL